MHEIKTNLAREWAWNWNKPNKSERALVVSTWALDTLDLLGSLWITKGASASVCSWRAATNPRRGTPVVHCTLLWLLCVFLNTRTCYNWHIASSSVLWRADRMMILWLWSDSLKTQIVPWGSHAHACTPPPHTHTHTHLHHLHLTHTPTHTHHPHTPHTHKQTTMNVASQESVASYVITPMEATSVSVWRDTSTWPMAAVKLKVQCIPNIIMSSS